MFQPFAPADLSNADGTVGGTAKTGPCLNVRRLWGRLDQHGGSDRPRYTRFEPHSRIAEIDDLRVMENGLAKNRMPCPAAAAKPVFFSIFRVPCHGYLLSRPQRAASSCNGSQARTAAQSVHDGLPFPFAGAEGKNSYAPEVIRPKVYRAFLRTRLFTARRQKIILPGFTRVCTTL